MKKLITLILIAFAISANAQVYKTVTMALDTPTNVAKLRAGTQTYNLTDTFKNYAQIQDGLISGGSATIGTGSVTIGTANYRINKTPKMSLPRTFTGISNSASGTQYYILVYGKNDNTLDTLQGVQDTIATVPTKPNGTVSINNILVGDGGVVSAAPDLSGYVLLTDVSESAIDNKIVRRSGAGLALISGGYLQNTLPARDAPVTITDVATLDSFGIIRRTSFSTLLDSLGGGSGTVTSITPVFGLTPNTPITTSGSFGVDTAVVRTVSNSYSLASGQPKLVSGTNIKTVNSASLLGSGDIPLEVPLTFGYGLTRATNTITADTTSGTGLVSKTRLTGALASKANIVSPTFSGTPIVPTASANTNNTQIASTAYSDAKVQNSLTASTTIAPSATAVNTGLATRENPLTFTLPLVRSTNTITVNAATTSASGIVSISSQTFAGQKEFQDSTIVNNFRFKALAGMGGGALVVDNTGKPNVAVMADRTLSNKLAKTSAYTVTLSDFGANGELILEVDCTGGAVTITLPSLANMTGVKLTAFKTDSSINAVTISGAVNINGSSSATLATQWASTTITGGTSVYLAK